MAKESTYGPTVPNNGQVIENGNHLQLLTQTGHYAQMWQKQLKHANKSSQP